MSSCTLCSIHIIFCYIHTDQRSTVISGSQQHITVTTSSPTLIPLSSAGHSLLKWLDHSSSTLMHSQLRIHIMLCYTHTDQQSTILSGSQVHCIYNELHTTVPTTSPSLSFTLKLVVKKTVIPPLLTHILHSHTDTSLMHTHTHAHTLMHAHTHIPLNHTQLRMNYVYAQFCTPTLVTVHGCVRECTHKLFYTLNCMLAELTSNSGEMHLKEYSTCSV